MCAAREVNVCSADRLIIQGEQESREQEGRPLAGQTRRVLGDGDTVTELDFRSPFTPDTR